MSVRSSLQPSYLVAPAVPPHRRGSGRGRRPATYAAAMPAPEPRSWLIDMDGVIVREEEPIEGSAAFLAGLRARGMPFLVLTNNSIYTPSDLAARLRMSGVDVSEDDIWTSALATARFLDDQRPGGSAFTIGEAGLTTALYEVGYVHTEYKPDYVVLGETRTYSFERITRPSGSSTGARASSPPTQPRRPPPPPA